MKKLMFLALLAMMSMALFAPVALAQDYDDDDGSASSSASAAADDDDGGMDDAGAMDDDDGSSSGSATASGSASASAVADDDDGVDDDDGGAVAQYDASASAVPLPDTGGSALLAPIAGLLLLGSGILSLRILRRD